MSGEAGMHVREYGESGPLVLVLHGGPGAAGYMKPVAEGLARSFRVLEPHQRGSGGEPLTVARHVADLHELVGERGESGRVGVVGHSWGAMLALAHAAAHPDTVGAMVLVGCGTFDRRSRARLDETVAARLEATGIGRRLERPCVEMDDPDERLAAMGRLVLPIYSHDLVSDDLPAACDSRAHDESWADMVRQQDAGVYPAALAAVDCPVLMLHGADDPHPGRMIRDVLAAHLSRLEYHEWEECGHYPWLERAVREEYFARQEEWLRSRLTPR